MHDTPTNGLHFADAIAPDAPAPKGAGAPESRPMPYCAIVHDTTGRKRRAHSL